MKTVSTAPPDLLWCVFQWRWRRYPWTAACPSWTKPWIRNLLQIITHRPKAALWTPPCEFIWRSWHEHLAVVLGHSWTGLLFYQLGDQERKKTLCTAWWAVGPRREEARGSFEETLQEARLQGTGLLTPKHQSFLVDSSFMCFTAQSGSYQVF